MLRIYSRFIPTYQVGDYCINDNDNKLYVCKTAIAVPESFNSDHWDAVAFSDAFGDMVLVQNEQPTTAANKIWFSESNVPDGVEVPTMDDIENIVAEEYDSSRAYDAGAYALHDNKLYKATTASAANDGWIAARWTQIDVTSELGDLETDLYHPFTNASLFEQGAISSASGANSNSDTRIRTKTYLYAGIKVLNVKDGYKYLICAWDHTDTYIGMWSGSIFQKTATWLTGRTNISQIGAPGYKYKIVFAKGGDENIEPSDGSNMTFLEITDETLSVVGFPADAKVIGDEISTKFDAYANVAFDIPDKRMSQDGKIVASPGAKLTVYYPCKPGEKIKWSGRSFWYNNAPSMCCIAFFDASKVFISGVTQVDGSSSTLSQLGEISTIAPVGTAYVVGSTNSNSDPYLHAFAISMNDLVTDLGDLQTIKENIQTFYPRSIRNGSFPNNANDSQITFGVFLLDTGVSSISVHTNRPVDADGAYYSLGYAFFATVKPDILYESGYIYGQQKNPDLIGTYRIGDEIPVPFTAKSVVLTIGQVKSDGSNWISLRDNSFDTYQLEVRSTLAIEYKPVYAYIGSNGNFEFGYPNIFSSARCAWRLSSNDLVIRYAGNQYNFTNADIIASLTSNDIYNDGTTDWVALRANYILVYDGKTNTLSSKIITTRLHEYEFPLLTALSGQFGSGLLYEKMLANLEEIKIANSIRDKQERELDLEATQYALNNAKFIRDSNTDTFTLIHISDVHGNTSALQRIMNDVGQIEHDGMICTGDINASVGEAISSWWNETVLTCVGNHDTATLINGSYKWDALDMATRSAYYIEPFESGWDIVHPAGKSYYYKDYNVGIRLIVLDAMLYYTKYKPDGNGTDADAQTTWLANIIDDARTNSLQVIIAIHTPAVNVPVVDCSFSRAETSLVPVGDGIAMPTDVTDVVSDAINQQVNPLVFVGYIAGHKHQDYIINVTNDGKQMMYCVTCATNTYAHWHTYSDQYRDAKHDAYNVLTIDPQNKLVKIIRGGGANIDNRMRTRRAICISYVTGQVVGEML